MIGKTIDSGWRDWDFVAKNAMDDAEIRIELYLNNLRRKLMIDAQNNVNEFIYKANINNASIVEWHNHHLAYEANETKERWINTFDIDALVGSYGITFDNLIQEQGRNNFIPSCLVEYKSYDDNSKGNFTWAQNRALVELCKLCQLPGLVIWTIPQQNKSYNYAYRVVWSKNSEHIDTKGLWSEYTYLKVMCKLRKTPEHITVEILKNKSNKINSEINKNELGRLGW